MPTSACPAGYTVTSKTNAWPLACRHLDFTVLPLAYPNTVFDLVKHTMFEINTKINTNIE